MATLKLNLQNIGLKNTISLKKTVENRKKFSKLALKMNDVQIESTQEQLKELDDDTDVKIAELREKLAKTDSLVESVKLKKEIKRMNLQRELNELEKTPEDAKKAESLIDEMNQGLIDALGLSDEQADEFNSYAPSTFEIAQAVSYINSRFAGMSDADFKTATKEQSGAPQDPKAS
ncbi:phage tail assembly chaperone [Fructilactobacillus myrtifloralis]|uniref:Phage tail assembly chaperone n=1 Tax=Fructilactobacillus myrtifloralis TaxID=2940301 RepID=A0ABY5BS62_9LACO|nr:phage tail assembly chaperone [Fructilactobacillus myrtifloralis]USS85083.1 phage tail assembly chaperone [Fructilactobacillus myrtifloralis]